MNSCKNKIAKTYEVTRFEHNPLYSGFRTEKGWSDWSPFKILEPMEPFIRCGKNGNAKWIALQKVNPYILKKHLLFQTEEIRCSDGSVTGKYALVIGLGVSINEVIKAIEQEDREEKEMVEEFEKNWKTRREFLSTVKDGERWCAKWIESTEWAESTDYQWEKFTGTGVINGRWFILDEQTDKKKKDIYGKYFILLHKV